MAMHGIISYNKSTHSQEPFCFAVANIVSEFVCLHYNYLNAMVLKNILGATASSTKLSILHVPKFHQHQVFDTAIRTS
jgi:hypothetical protein